MGTVRLKFTTAVRCDCVRVTERLLRAIYSVPNESEGLQPLTAVYLRSQLLQQQQGKHSRGKIGDCIYVLPSSICLPVRLSLYLCLSLRVFDGTDGRCGLAKRRRVAVQEQDIRRLMLH